MNHAALILSFWIYCSYGILDTYNIPRKHFQSFFPESELPKVVQAFTEGLQAKNVEGLQLKVLKKDGSSVHIELNKSPIIKEGKVIGFQGVFRDITERKRMEEQLIRSAKMASLGMIAEGIAKELRNPLGVISSIAQFLLKHSDNALLCSECAQKILAETQHTSLIIESLLGFAHPQAVKMRYVDLHPILEDTIAQFTSRMASQEVTLRKEFQPSLPKVYGNPELLQQVFANLIINACNAMSHGGTLTIATRAAKLEEVEIRISDTGYGIPPEHLSRIFDPFFTTMPEGEGFGLGLPISYNIIQQHQGNVEVESQPGKGTVFIVWLPCRPPV
jgi:signal transduction histidine kinase